MRVGSLSMPYRESVFNLGMKKLKMSICVPAAEVTPQSFETLAKLGYDGIELNLPEPRNVDPSYIKELKNTSTLEVSAIDTGLAYTQHGLSFTDPGEDIRKKAIQRVREYSKLASKVDAPVVVIGLIRGSAKGSIGEVDAWDLTVECLRECEKGADTEGIIMGIEPLNRYETNVINRVDEALELVRELNSNRMGIVADTYHMNIEESSVTEPLIRAKRDLVHIHFADNNRLAPGMGHIDFHNVLSTLESVRYHAFISAEILPEPNFITAAAETIKYLRPLLGK